MLFFALTPSETLAQTTLNLPQPGAMMPGSPAATPVLMKGLKVHPGNPFLFDFILDVGTSDLAVSSAAFKSESERLIKYFLASLTLKDEDQWVNLSPFEKDRIMSASLGKTALGRDMLAQDYILKQFTASLVDPEKEPGKTFWEKVYARAKEQFGTADIPVDAFTKVWIVADKAKVLERNNAALVIGAHLKVMLESDYLAQRKAATASPGVSGQVLREVVLPAIEKEVNEGQHFAPLRQIFYAMILSCWYKRSLKKALLNQVYSNQEKISGVRSNDPAVTERIYARYLEAYRTGALHAVKEVPDETTGQPVPRKYFSGGIPSLLGADRAMEISQALAPGDNAMDVGKVGVVRAQFDTAQEKESGKHLMAKWLALRTVAFGQDIGSFIMRAFHRFLGRRPPPVTRISLGDNGAMEVYRDNLAEAERLTAREMADVLERRNSGHYATTFMVDFDECLINVYTEFVRLVKEEALDLSNLHFILMKEFYAGPAGNAWKDSPHSVRHHLEKILFQPLRRANRGFKDENILAFEGNAGDVRSGVTAFGKGKQAVNEIDLEISGLVLDEPVILVTKDFVKERSLFSPEIERVLEDFNEFELSGTIDLENAVRHILEKHFLGRKDDAFHERLKTALMRSTRRSEWSNNDERELRLLIDQLLGQRVTIYGDNIVKKRGVLIRVKSDIEARLGRKINVVLKPARFYESQTVRHVALTVPSLVNQLGPGDSLTALPVTMFTVGRSLIGRSNRIIVLSDTAREAQALGGAVAEGPVEIAAGVVAGISSQSYRQARNVTYRVTSAVARYAQRVIETGSREHAAVEQALQHFFQPWDTRIQVTPVDDGFYVGMPDWIWEDAESVRDLLARLGRYTVLKPESQASVRLEDEFFLKRHGTDILSTYFWPEARDTAVRLMMRGQLRLEEREGDVFLEVKNVFGSMEVRLSSGTVRSFKAFDVELLEKAGDAESWQNPFHVVFPSPQGMPAGNEDIRFKGSVHDKPFYISLFEYDPESTCIRIEGFIVRKGEVHGKSWRYVLQTSFILKGNSLEVRHRISNGGRSPLLVTYVHEFPFKKLQGGRLELLTQTVQLVRHPEGQRQTRQDVTRAAMLLNPGDAMSRTSGISYSTDHAMEELGGIDMNSRNLRMEVTPDGKGMDVTVDRAMLERFKSGHFSGIVPVIIRVTGAPSALSVLK